MAEFRWIQMFLFLILELQITVTEQYSSIIRNGDDVTLPCESVTANQNKCDNTNWIFSSSGGYPVDLVKHGQIHEDTEVKSDRLGVTANCSLVIKKITQEDAGVYYCRQHISGQEPQVDLSVINIYEHQDDDKVTLTCSVLKYEHCQDTVEWLYDGNSDDFTNLGKSSCGAAVTFTASNLNQTSHYSELFKCKVTERNGGTLLCNVTPQSSCEKHTISTGNMGGTREENKTSAHNDDPTKLPVCTDCSALSYIMLVMRVAELLLITVITVLLFRARGNQRPPDDNIDLNSVRSQTAKRSGPAASQEQNDEDDGAVNYENFGEPSTSVRLH
ncbi:uncharacterized protein LOC121882140 [Thunnus maccoyii]|uniref:uncharacterized protein LOC121882140 n=1 Tax=Thunnus maccoyii TaxID=8240 RepID=UPI001C4C2DD8|nr:uncharacterized protein LOC121882140 [Thunnus maccoyii]